MPTRPGWEAETTDESPSQYMPTTSFSVWSEYASTHSVLDGLPPRAPRGHDISIATLMGLVTLAGVLAIAAIGSLSALAAGR